MPIRTNSKDIKSVMCPAVSGVRKEAQAVRIYRNGAWVDVWANMKPMTQLSNTITVGDMFVYADGSMQYTKFYSNGTGSVAGGGTMIFYIDGEWTNPTITFDWVGGHLYDSAGYVWHSTNGGSISAYHRVKGATSAGTTTILSRMGIEYTGNDFNYETGSASKTLSGTFDRLGLSITVLSHNTPYSYASSTVSLSNIKIGTQRIGIPLSAEFFKQAY